jgi:GNAT superfamily N-acetyltransferase
VSDLRFRQATVADAPRVAELVIAGFATYRAFAPARWTASPLPEELEQLVATFAKATAWCRLADDAAGLAGHVGWVAASESRVPIDEPGLVHFRQLFVRRDLWGSGLAATLQAAAFDAASQQGYTAMRLFTPAAHARGRRFYEREGWTLACEPFDDAFGMPLVEYRRAL